MRKGDHSGCNCSVPAAILNGSDGQADGREKGQKRETRNLVTEWL